MKFPIVKGAKGVACFGICATLVLATTGACLAIEVACDTAKWILAAKDEIGEAVTELLGEIEIPLYEERDPSILG